MTYRSDIQILRGIAVLLVVVYHMFPKALPGGFIGVDIFFVISGFLMSALYLKGNEANPVLNFYIRRFKRIFPAYIVVISLTLFISAFLLVPYEFHQLILQSIASVSIVPNIYFWSGESYFDEYAFRPLLHLWSLGVELQFYLIVPVIFWLISKSKILFITLTVFTLLTCLVVVDLSAKSAFFLLPFRMWEFLIGFGAAFLFSNHGNLKQNFKKHIFGSLLVIMLLLAGFYSADLNTHPGLFALLICIATAVVLITGISKFIVDSKIGIMFEKLGQYSYSLYLVHFPVLILMFHEPFGDNEIYMGSNLKSIFAVLLMIVTTYFLYHLVERSNWLENISRLSIKKIYLLPIFAISALSVSVPINGVVFDDKETMISNAPLDTEYWRCGKIQKLKSLINKDHIACQMSSGVEITDEGGVLMIGDSHADSIKISVNRIVSKHNKPFYFMIENCNLGDQSCNLENIKYFVEQNNIEKVILHSLYKNIDHEPISKLVDMLPESIQIYLIDPVPVFPSNVPAYLYSEHNKTVKDEQFYQRSDYFISKYSEYLNPLNELKIKRLPTLDYLCSPECAIADGLDPLYYDSTHLTLTGARKLEPMLDKYLFN